MSPLGKLHRLQVELHAQKSTRQCIANSGHAKVVVVLHPAGDEDGAAERKIAAVVGLQALGGGAQVGSPVPALVLNLTAELPGTVLLTRGMGLSKS